MEDPSKPHSLVSLCVGCGHQILDRFILRVFPDLEWHAACLKCAECKQHLDESCTCFIKDGRMLCKKDYSRLYATKCSRCHQPFNTCNYVMRTPGDGVYHMQCFRCVGCDRQLVPGDRFTLRDGELHCTARTRHCGGLTAGSVHSGRSSNSLWSRDQRSEKGTRVRTVLSEAQLETLRSWYNTNPRPDAVLKEQLVELTGLSPRVIRVWFQNKRCKDKKISAAEREMQQRTHRQAVVVPCLASSLESLDRGMLDVQSFQPSLQLLTSLSSLSDKEHIQGQDPQLDCVSEGMVSCSSVGSEIAPLELPLTPNGYITSPEPNE